VLREEAGNTNCIVFGFTRWGSYQWYTAHETPSNKIHGDWEQVPQTAIKRPQTAIKVPQTALKRRMLL
jgi:hypothetical protein